MLPKPSGLCAVVAERSVRRLCPACKAPAKQSQDLLGLPVEHAHVARGCDDCGQTGYDGRLVLAELLLLDQEPLGQAILARRDVHKLEEAAFECGIIGRWQRACQAVEQGLTSPGEVPRVPGLSGPSLGDGHQE